MPKEWMENKMRRGGTCGCLDCGGDEVDWDSGEFGPVHQFLRDPGHINKLDILDQDGVGCLKLGFVDGGDILQGIDTEDGWDQR